MLVEVDPDDILERTPDNRGRITLGKEYANRSVQIALLSEGDNDD
jgi:hypothetical protein